MFSGVIGNHFNLFVGNASDHQMYIRQTFVLEHFPGFLYAVTNIKHRQVNRAAHLLQTVYRQQKSFIILNDTRRIFCVARLKR